jgi:hypothetical protein
MVDTLKEQLQADLVAAFRARIEALRREGVPSFPPPGGRTPWAEAPELDKLEAIESVSANVSPRDVDSPDGSEGLEIIRVPGVTVLAEVEAHVDYARLPAVQRDMLEALRRRLDAGPPGDAQPDRKDFVAMRLARIVGVGHLDRMVQTAKESDVRPWAGMPEAEKARVLVDLAAEAGAPGGYALRVVEREVDYDLLPPWRRAALAELRARFDRGALDSENANPLYQGDRAELALRLAELEARVEDAKHIGDADPDPGRYRRWEDLHEEVKLDFILREMRELRLETESATYFVIDREVDIAHVPDKDRREFEAARQEAWPARGREKQSDFLDDGITWIETPPPSRAESDAFWDGFLEGGFNSPAEPGRPTRPGPEETPMERVERQITHIKVLPDPFDFRIEELGPWDTEVSDDWRRLPEAEKLSRLAEQVDWRDIDAADKRRLLEREVDFAQVPEEARRQALGEGLPTAEAADRLSSPSSIADGSASKAADYRADVFDALMTRLEAFGDEFTRQAHTEEQKARAAAFGDLVADTYSSIAYIADAGRQHGPPPGRSVLMPAPVPAQERLPSPGDIVHSQGADGPEQDHDHERDNALSTDRSRGR